MTDNTKRGTDAAPTPACKTCDGERFIERALSSTSYTNVPCPDCAAPTASAPSGEAYNVTYSQFANREHTPIAPAIEQQAEAKLTDAQYLEILEPTLSRAGVRRFLNGDPIELYPGHIQSIIERARAHLSATNSEAQPIASVPAQPEQAQQSNVLPPTRGTGGQHGAGTPVLTDERIIEVCEQTCGWLAGAPDAELVAFGRAIEAEVASRFAQGGVTSNEAVRAAVLDEVAASFKHSFRPEDRLDPDYIATCILSHKNEIQQGKQHAEKHARADHQGAAEDERHDAGATGAGGGAGAHQHHQHREAKSGGHGCVSSEDRGGAGVSDRGEVRAAVNAPSAAQEGKQASAPGQGESK